MPVHMAYGMVLKVLSLLQEVLLQQPQLPLRPQLQLLTRLLPAVVVAAVVLWTQCPNHGCRCYRVNGLDQCSGRIHTGCGRLE